MNQEIESAQPLKPLRNNQTSVIALEGMEFFSYHGCLKEERVIGTKFLVDLYLHADTSLAEQSDLLKDTVDYCSVYECVKQQMDTRSDLLEHVGRRILNAILLLDPRIKSATIKIKKLNPPLGGKLESVSIRLTEAKEIKR